MIDDIYYYLYAFFVGSMFVILAGVAVYFWGNRKFGAKIEKRGMIIFSEDPLEKR